MTPDFVSVIHHGNGVQRQALMKHYTATINATSGCYFDCCQCFATYTTSPFIIFLWYSSSRHVVHARILLSQVPLEDDKSDVCTQRRFVILPRPSKLRPSVQSQNTSVIVLLLVAVGRKRPNSGRRMLTKQRTRNEKRKQQRATLFSTNVYPAADMFPAPRRFCL